MNFTNGQNIPVVLMVFNRPKLVSRLLTVLRTIKPKTVLIVADGPRSDVPEDKAACTEVRMLIEQGIDWDARVTTHYAETNLGLRLRIASGLTWAFQQVERAIILEDDCLPHKDFFPFCTELLEHYKDDTRIGVITGDNFQKQPFDCGASYYFSRYPHCWGWATWRRAWQFYDDRMTDWPNLRDQGWLRDVFGDVQAAARWSLHFDRAYYREKIQSWDYPWFYSLWKQSMLTIIPRVNLVTNVGFGEGATNTHKINTALANLPVSELEFPLKHPNHVLIDYAADRYYQSHCERRVKWRRRVGFWFRNRWRSQV